MTQQYPPKPEEGKLSEEPRPFVMPIIPTRAQQKADRQAARGSDTLTLGAWVLLLSGLGVLAYGIYQPGLFDLRTASAIQIQQVYAMVSNTVLVGIGLLIAAGVVGLLGRK